MATDDPENKPEPKKEEGEKGKETKKEVGGKEGEGAKGAIAKLKDAPPWVWIGLAISAAILIYMIWSNNQNQAANGTAQGASDTTGTGNGTLQPGDYGYGATGGGGTDLSGQLNDIQNELQSLVTSFSNPFQPPTPPPVPVPPPTGNGTPSPPPSPWPVDKPPPKPPTGGGKPTPPKGIHPPGKPPTLHPPHIVRHHIAHKGGVAG
jgi:hypothetical protein